MSYANFRSVPVAEDPLHETRRWSDFLPILFCFRLRGRHRDGSHWIRVIGWRWWDSLRRMGFSLSSPHSRPRRGSSTDGDSFIRRTGMIGFLRGTAHEEVQRLIKNPKRCCGGWGMCGRLATPGRNRRMNPRRVRRNLRGCGGHGGARHLPMPPVPPSVSARRSCRSGGDGGPHQVHC